MMEPIRISIPDRRVDQEAGAIVIEALREAGINPTNPKVQSNQMIRHILGAWGRGEWTRGQVIKSLRNLTILNPNLKI